MPKCNLCDNSEFVEHMGRAGEKCRKCGSLRRHRVALEVYQKCGMFDCKKGEARVLHLAPEGVLYRRIRSAIGTGYMPADARPEAYYSIDCVKMMLPDGLAMFPDGYFDFIIHNHVLEHIPGSFRDHLTEIHRVVRPGGYHIFSVPGPRISKETEEGGEHLTAEERMARFGQIDHLKMFGPDLPAFLEAFPGGTFGWDGLSDDKRAELNVRPKSNVFWSGIRAKPSSGS